MAEGSNTASSFIWAIAFMIIVAILAGVVYYSGFLGKTKNEKVDINISTPSTSR